MSEDNKPNWGLFLIYAIVCILLGIWIGVTDQKRSPKYSPSMIPPRPDTEEMLYFDHTREEWLKVYRGNHRANDKIKPQMTEREIQRYLERKIPNYLKDTYWGEEYDIGDWD